MSVDEGSLVWISSPGGEDSESAVRMRPPCLGEVTHSDQHAVHFRALPVWRRRLGSAIRRWPQMGPRKARAQFSKDSTTTTAATLAANLM